MSYKDDKLFMTIAPHVFAVEGGYANHSADKGGPTKFGVAWNYHAARLGKEYGITDIRQLTKEQAHDFYYRFFWLPSGAAKIPSMKLAFTYFDVAVNSGQPRARRMLKALTKNPEHFSGPPSNQVLWNNLFREFQANRRMFYHGIVAGDPSQRAFLKGWLNRLKHVEKVAARMT